MPRPGEYTYFEQIGEEGRQHSVNKPFSDDGTPRFFLDMGVIFSLLPKPPARVLDCGCGTGWLSYFLARKGYHVVGQDCNADAVALARTSPVFLKTSGSVEFVCSDFEALGYRDEFDGIVFYASLHHSQAVDEAVECAYNALRPGGVFIAIEPGRGHGKAAEETIKKFDVGDRDMPPWLVVQLGKQVGFRERRIYQHAGQLASTLYQELPHSARLKRIWGVPGVRVLALVLSVLVLKRYNGTVWMRK